MSARDPRVIGGVAAWAAATGILPAYTAARNGLRLNPAAVLREE